MALIKIFQRKAVNNQVESPKIDNLKEIGRNIRYNIRTMNQNSLLIDINHMKRKLKKYKHFSEVIYIARNT